MIEKVDDFKHAWMRRMEPKLDQLLEDHTEFRMRLGRLEKSAAETHVHLAEHSGRMDQVHTRLNRIERRLDLTEAEAVP
jgi:hypothetical protein